MHIDELIEKLELIKKYYVPDANIYFTAEIKNVTYEVDFSSFNFDDESNDVEMLFVFEPRKDWGYEKSLHTDLCTRLFIKH